MRRFFSLIALTVVFVAAPAVLAQSVDVSVVGDVVLDDEVILSIEVTDANGALVAASPQVSFSPAEAILDEIFTDCSDPDEQVDCQVNSRGVVGIYESSFLLIDEPVTVTVQANGVTQQLVVSAGGTQTVEVSAEATTSSETVTESTSASATAGTATVTPSSVQVGPTPSVWFILLPLMVICASVTFFVFRTLED